MTSTTSPVESRAIRVLVVDDQRMFAESIARLLSNESDINVVGVTGSAAEAIVLATELAPDVAVIDFELPDGNGVAVTQDVLASSPTTKVLILTGGTDSRRLGAAMDAGCLGYLTKDRALGELVVAVRVIDSGESYIPTQLLSSMLTTLRDSKHRIGSDLTRRELEILEHLRSGLATDAIAEREFLSLHTVRNHVRNILTKLGAHSKLEAVAIARREGLFSDH